MYTTIDRRVKPRISCDYPAIIDGHDEVGRKFSEHGKLVNLSASGLFMTLNREIENGSKLAVTINLSDSLSDKNAPRLATNGIVVRTEPQADGIFGVAMKFLHYRFL